MRVIHKTAGGVTVYEGIVSDENVALHGVRPSITSMLGYIPENISHKEVDALDSSLIKYPCNSVVTAALSQNTNTIYVDNKRTDTYTEAGTYIYPFKTITAAMNSITGNSSTNRFVIKIATGDIYTETLAINKDFVTLEGYGETVLSGAITLTAPHFRLKNLKTTGNVTGTYTVAFLAEICDCSVTTGTWTVSCSVSGAYVQISGGTTIWSSDVNLTGITGVVSCQNGYFEGTHTFTGCYMELIGFQNYEGIINLETGTEIHIGAALCINTVVNLKTGATAYVDATAAGGITLNNTGGTIHYTTPHNALTNLDYATSGHTGFAPAVVESAIVSGSSYVMADHTEYRAAAAVTALTFTEPSGHYECWIKFTTESSGAITITMPNTIVGSPVIGNSETWEIRVKDGVSLATKVS